VVARHINRSNKNGLFSRHSRLPAAIATLLVLLGSARRRFVAISAS